MNKPTEKQILEAARMARLVDAFYDQVKDTEADFKTHLDVFVNRLMEFIGTQEKPIAWLHSKRPDSDVVTDKVRQFAIDCGLKTQEFYTIPLIKAVDTKQAKE